MVTEVGGVVFFLIPMPHIVLAAVKVTLIYSPFVVYQQHAELVVSKMAPSSYASFELRGTVVAVTSVSTVSAYFCPGLFDVWQSVQVLETVCHLSESL